MYIAVLGQTGGDFRPALSVIGGPERVRLVIIQLVTINGYISCPGGVGRRVNDADKTPLAELLRSNVRPMLSVIARYVHQTIVRPGPDHALFDRRFRQRKHRIVVLDAGIIFRQRSTGRLLFALVVPGQVSADGRPRHSPVRRLEYRLSAVIEHLRVVR